MKKDTLNTEVKQKKDWINPYVLKLRYMQQEPKGSQTYFLLVPS